MTATRSRGADERRRRDMSIENCRAVAGVRRNGGSGSAKARQIPGAAPMYSAMTEAARDLDMQTMAEAVAPP